MTTRARRRLAVLLLVAAGLAPAPAPASAQTPLPAFQPKNEGPDGTVLADRDILDCDIKQPPVKNGPPPPPELARMLMRCVFEKPPIPGGEGAVTVDIDHTEIGPPRPWDPRHDVGSGSHDTLVYPVRAVWTHKTFLRQSTVVHTNESVFFCFVSGLDKWDCATGHRIKTGPVRRIPVK